MNRQSNPLRAATILMAASTLLLVACEGNARSTPAPPCRAKPTLNNLHRTLR